MKISLYLNSLFDFDSGYDMSSITVRLKIVPSTTLATEMPTERRKPISLIIA